MKSSSDRILTTHTGSLPRSKALSALLVKREQRKAYDGNALADNIHGLVYDHGARFLVDAAIDDESEDDRFPAAAGAAADDAGGRKAVEQAAHGTAQSAADQRE